MRVHRSMARSLGLRLLLGLLATLCAAGCGGGGGGDPVTANRLVLVVDPTVLRDVDSAGFDRQLGEKLRTAVADLPEDTFIDLYFVGLGQSGGLPVDYRASLPFREDETTEDGHIARARAVADTVAQLVQERWAASNEQPNRPSSCILTALYRAQEMTKLGEKRDEDVTLVVVSDLLEACSDFGGYNFERQIPDSVGALPVQADLSGADRVLVLRMQTSGAITLPDEPRLIHLWSDVLDRWGVDTTAVEFTPNFPETLIPEPQRG